MRSALNLCFVLASLLAAPVAGQDAAIGGQQAQVEEAPQLAQAGPADAPPALPLRAAPERTLRAYWHVFIAFAATWVLLFGYAISVGRRFGRLEDEVRKFRGA